MKKLGYLILGFAGMLSISSCGQSKGETDKNGSSLEEKKGKFPIEKTEAQWREILSPQAFQVMVKEATEPAFKNAYYNNHKKGIYVSVATGEPLFSSEDKFDSGTGWPSFTKPINDKAVIWTKDTSYGMTRDEVIEAKTGLHLGHVFRDGPAPTGLRYCVNSAALKFIPAK
ncbi:peptide-methionine (R)-S-oxide reductase [Pelobium manganitolerans]|uniref:peptide-methionine (R)-S-oxide reductase n=1 Tax=Pelobium manganitolerans TaxID=1842495 RepID=A0A419S3C6_9SPHI|nr:peptide-methionine (R)-S-oxide reductase MsrB [Pelobium manganitolerans]RKD13795.1 peptide-methionine (R)-S-oxide reductase [Pelobium manganitolerans]